MTTNETSVRPDHTGSIDAPQPLVLEEGVVDLWCFSLRAPQAAVDVMRTRLSSDELLRAARFRFERDRTPFIVARATTRELLGRYADVPAVDIRFEQGPFGKPTLQSATRRWLNFNMSHTRDVMLVAVARGFEVGIDVEAIDPSLDHIALARRYFTPAELERLLQLRTNRRATMFSAIWTLKEALVKAKGIGLSAKLDAFDVCTALQPGEGPVPVEFSTAARAWWVRRAHAPVNCTAAVAASRPFQVKSRTATGSAHINEVPSGADA